jgi:hypothetical protein
MIMHRSIFAIVILFISPQVFAEEASSQAVDLAMAGSSKANLDSFSGIRQASATIALLSRYQVAVSGELATGVDWKAEAAALDSNTGPVSLGLMFQYSNGDAVVQGDALPGWRLPDETLVQSHTDVLFGAGTAVSFNNRQYALGVGAFYIGKTINREDRIYNKSAFELWQERNDIDESEVYSSHQLELNTSAAAKFLDQIVVTAGANDLLAVSEARYFFAACRWSPLDMPINGSYNSYGGVEIDLETMLNDDGFGLHFLGLSGDLPIGGKVKVRSGYRYDFNLLEHVPAMGFGLDNGSYSIDYGAQLRFGEELIQQHAIGVRVRL